jgi:hypothetical protein
MKHSENIADLVADLVVAQGQIDNAAKRSSNPHLKNKYADLASVWDACREALSSNGLCVLQGAAVEGNSVLITTKLAHISGQWVESVLAMPVGKADAHGVGSAITYGRRYSLMAMVGIAPEDDDAGQPQRPQQQQRQQQPKAAPKAKPDPAVLTSEHIAQLTALRNEAIDRDHLGSEHWRPFMAFAMQDTTLSEPKAKPLGVQAEAFIKRFGTTDSTGQLVLNVEALTKALDDWEIWETGQLIAGTPEDSQEHAQAV